MINIDELGIQQSFYVCVFVRVLTWVCGICFFILSLNSLSNILQHVGRGQRQRQERKEGKGKEKGQEREEGKRKERKRR